MIYERWIRHETRSQRERTNWSILRRFFPRGKMASDGEQQPQPQNATHSEEAEEPHLGGITAHSENVEKGNPERNVKDWMSSMIKAEVDRLNSQGQRVIPVDVRNCSVIKTDSGNWLNRIEANTSFDFEKVQQVLLSESHDCPVKPDYSFVYVVLFTDKPLPLLVPYIYCSTGQYQSNDLTQWAFINNKLQEARRWVESYTEIQG